MYKKRIKFTDFNGTEREQDFYFNLTEAELTELQMSTPGGLEEMVKTIIDSQDGPTIIKLFKDIIVKSYGEKSLDGLYFNKSPEITEKFTHTNAYSVLFMELATNDKAASEFINGIVPKSIAVQEQENKIKNIPAPPMA